VRGVSNFSARTTFRVSASSVHVAERAEVRFVLFEILGPRWLRRKGLRSGAVRGDTRGFAIERSAWSRNGKRSARHIISNRKTEKMKQRRSYIVE
jgi:hypothetical protein